MFSPGQVYSGLFVFFIIGAITPVVIYLLAKRRPKSPVRFLMAPLIFGGAGAMPPATPLNYLSWGAVGFIFQFWVKKRHFRWWSSPEAITELENMGLPFSRFENGRVYQRPFGGQSKNFGGLTLMRVKARC